MSNKSGTGGEVISLPKGGGALSGIGETFAPDLHTGTGNFTVPIVLPAGRGDLQPQLSLAYSTGNRNGPFGLGWTLSVPGVSRSTVHGVPRYDDETDTFVLSGAEELVPVHRGEHMTQYRPRTEGLFARILHHRDAENDFWEVWAPDGLRSIYGTPAAAGADPAVVRDPADPRRVFSWKLHRTIDPFGNEIAYEYQRDTGEPAGQSGWDQLYLSAVRYVDYTDENGEERFLISVTLDHDPPDARPDAFSDFRAGFEVRTRRRCRRIAIATDADIRRRVRTYELVYLDDRVAAGDLADTVLPLNRVSLLSQVRLVGHDDERPDGESEQAMPPLDFGYSTFDPRRRDLVPLQGADLPSRSLASDDFELADLFGNGLPDIIEMNGVVRYWRNLGGGRFDRPRPMSTAPSGVRLADPGVQLVDADGDGRIDLLATVDGLAGYFPLNFDGSWDRGSFRRYAQAPSFNFEDPDVRLLDLDGDGVTDALRAGTRFEHYFNDAATGWSPPRVVARRRAEVFPDVNLADPRVHLADFTGDGRQDIVLVHDGNVEYWPNLGRGDWGHRRHMRDSPRMPSGFDPKRILLGDVDGDGVADFVYVDDDRVLLWINQSGNRWSARVEISGTPPVTDMDAVRLVDLLGTGVAGVLWSADAAAPGRDHLWFLDFTADTKPYLVHEMRNNMGAVTRVEYAPSTRFYLDDQQDPDTRWRTPLPFPVQVVTRVAIIDELSRGKLSTQYRYRHGHWDGAEREFRGFGRVDQLSSETFEDYHRSPAGDNVPAFADVPAANFSPPTLTRTWFHSGPVGPEHGDWQEGVADGDHWSGDPQVLAERPGVAQILADTSRTRREKRDAVRALRGTVLRTEFYALDGSPRQDRPYTVTESLSDVHEVELGPGSDGVQRRVYFPHIVAQRTTHWERGDDPMTNFSFTGDYDLACGLPREQIEVAVPRGRDFRIAADPGEPYLGTSSVTRLSHRDDDDHYLIGRVASTTTHEILNDGALPIADLLDSIRQGAGSLRIVGQTVNHYDGDAFVGLPVGELGEFGLLVRTERLVLTEGIIREAFGSDAGLRDEAERPPYLDPQFPPQWTGDYPEEFRIRLSDCAGYSFHAGHKHEARGYFKQAISYRYDFHDTAGGRGLRVATRDQMGHDSSIVYDRFQLLPIAVQGPTGLTTSVRYDPRVQQPNLVTDPNGNRTTYDFTPLGLLATTAMMGKEEQAVGDTADVPGTRFAYDLMAFIDRDQPVSVRKTVREHHIHDTHVPLPDREATITNVEYSDGFGRQIQTRTQAEKVRFGEDIFANAPDLPLDPAQPGGPIVELPAPHDGVIVSGWRAYDNKGKVVAKYDPFFASGYDFAAAGDLQLGQRVTMSYDPRGRLIRTQYPNGSEQHVIYGVPAELDDTENFAPSPWEIWTYDANDNAGRTHADVAKSYQDHWNTPGTVVVDALGRTVKTIERNGPDPSSDWFVARSVYDSRGNVLAVIDAVGRVAYQTVYDLVGNGLRSESLDAGTRRTMLDARGSVIETRDSKGALTLTLYDALNRPTRVWARDSAREPVTLREHLRYGEDQQTDSAQAASRNTLGRLIVHHDEAGRLTAHAYDFKGNLLEKTRNVVRDDVILAAFETPPPGFEIETFHVDWEPTAGETVDQHAFGLLNGTDYTVRLAYDALNRVTLTLGPSDVKGERHKLTARYNGAGALVALDVDGTSYVEDVVYNAKGQQALVVYGDGVMTRYAYDRQTYRLRRQRTERFIRGEGRSYTPRGEPLQDFAYTYDLNGNILAIVDRTPGSGIPASPAGPDVLHRVFTYDPVGRLKSATGRECDTSALAPWDDSPRCNDPTRTRGYTDHYRHDAADNLGEVRHVAQAASFTRTLTEVAEGNRLLSVADGQRAVAYSHDACGNVLTEGLARHFEWNHADRMRAFRVQLDGAEPSVHAQYLYDHSGKRVKRLIRRQGGQVDTTVYIDRQFEHHRRSVSATSEEHNVMHVLDDERVAMIRIGSPFHDDDAPAVLFHHSDHLRSSHLVMSADGSFMNREEFTPYGETSFGSFARKRYRFLGKEREDVSGLGYHGARYYAPWLGRWMSPDPIGAVDGLNLYAYARSCPVSYSDSSGLRADGSNNLTEPLGSEAEEDPSYYANEGVTDDELARGDPEFAAQLEADRAKADQAASAPGLWDRLKTWRAARGERVERNMAEMRKHGGYAGPPSHDLSPWMDEMVTAAPEAQSKVGGALFGQLRSVAKIKDFFSSRGPRPAAPTASAAPAAGAATAAAVPSVTQRLMALRDDALAAARAKAPAGITARAFGNMIDDEFKRRVLTGIATGKLPSTLRVTPRFVYGVDVFDAATRTGWDLTTATVREVAGHDLRYLTQGMFGAGYKGRAMSDGTILQDVCPLVYSR